MSDSWWPEGFDLPAFRVKRQTYGLHTGGDYVRGSSVETLPHTALRYPTRAFDPSLFDITARGIIFVTAFDYHTIQVEWNWPESVRDTFQEVSVVRSTFGAPQAPLEGQTIFRALRENLPTHDVEGVPELNPPPIIYDQPLPSGHWYYYTAFFRTNPYDWTPLMSDQTLIPKEYGHSSHLWNTLPPWYQYSDDNYRVGSGFLRQFLTVFGFELDRTREEVESLQKLHWVDRCPSPLLKHLGANYGQPYESGLGDVRYRALLANYSHLQSMRGTAKGLLGLIETVSKYDCDLTQGSNNVLLPDDSNFMTGTGHWAPAHPTLDYTDPAKATYLTYDKVSLTVNTGVAPPLEAPGATGTLLVDSAVGDTADIFITAGAGKLDADTEFIPLYASIPVDPGEVYGFSAWVKMAAPGPVKLMMLAFQTSGQLADASDVISGNTTTPPDSNWFEVQMIAPVPDDAHYFVPAMYFESRVMSPANGSRSPRIDIAAVMVYQFDNTSAPVTLIAPDRYLTMGDPAEKMGEDEEQGGGFTLGAP